MLVVNIIVIVLDIHSTLVYIIIITNIIYPPNTPFIFSMSLMILFGEYTIILSQCGCWMNINKNMITINLSITMFGL